MTINGLVRRCRFALSNKLGDVTGKPAGRFLTASVGSFSKGRLTIPPTLTKGGSYKVYASWRGSTASVPIVIRLIAPDKVDSSAPADAKTYFRGRGGSAPTLGIRLIRR